MEERYCGSGESGSSQQRAAPACGWLSGLPQAADREERCCFDFPQGRVSQWRSRRRMCGRVSTAGSLSVAPSLAVPTRNGSSGEGLLAGCVAVPAVLTLPFSSPWSEAKWQSQEGGEGGGVAGVQITHPVRGQYLTHSLWAQRFRPLLGWGVGEGSVEAALLFAVKESGCLFSWVGCWGPNRLTSKHRYRSPQNPFGRLTVPSRLTGKSTYQRAPLQV